MVCCRCSGETTVQGQEEDSRRDRDGQERIFLAVGSEDGDELRFQRMSCVSGEIKGQQMQQSLQALQWRCRCRT